VLVPVVTFNVPHAVNKFDQPVFLEVDEPPDRAPDQVIIPPALKKYLAELASAKVIVCTLVREFNQVFEYVATPPAVIVDPTAVALLRLVKQLDKLVEKLLLTAIVSPAVGLVMAVTVVLVWLAIVVNRENNVDHWVAVTVEPVDTVDTGLLCPQPASSVPVAQIVLTFATALFGEAPP